MEVSGQLHAPAAVIPVEESSLPSLGAHWRRYRLYGEKNKFVRLRSTEIPLIGRP